MGQEEGVNLFSSEDESMSEMESLSEMESRTWQPWSPGHCILDATGATGSIPRMCLAYL